MRCLVKKGSGSIFTNHPQEDSLSFLSKSVYSRHSSRILRGVEKNSRQPEFELTIRSSKPKVITGSQGMVDNTFQERGKGGGALS